MKDWQLKVENLLTTTKMLADQQNHIAVSLNKHAMVINNQAEILGELIDRLEVLAITAERMAAVQEVTAAFLSHVLPEQINDHFAERLNQLQSDPYLSFNRDHPAEENHVLDS